MPKLWTETIEGHRQEVRQAILDATATLAAEHGLLSVTMSRIAEETGIGRATLYKYFPDVEAILLAWHERQVGGHLAQLVVLAERPGDAIARLEAVLEAYALISHDSHGHHNTELGAFLHRSEQFASAERQLSDLIRELLAEGIEAGEIRGDINSGELANYCVHAIAGAARLTSKVAIRRLVAVILAGLSPRDT